MPLADIGRYKRFHTIMAEIRSFQPMVLLPLANFVCLIDLTVRMDIIWKIPPFPPLLVFPVQQLKWLALLCRWSINFKNCYTIFQIINTKIVTLPPPPIPTELTGEWSSASTRKRLKIPSSLEQKPWARVPWLPWNAIGRTRSRRCTSSMRSTLPSRESSIYSACLTLRP